MSPDGQWIAYASNESDQNEIYVQPFPALDSKSQISTTGGTSPVWGPEGRALFYRNLREAMLVVPIATEGSLALGIPEVLFEARYLGSGQPTEQGRHYDLAPDGQRFLMIKPATDDTTSAQIIVVENWFEELTVRVPVP